MRERIARQNLFGPLQDRRLWREPFAWIEEFPFTIGDTPVGSSLDHTRSDFRFRKSLLVRDMLIVVKCDLFAPLMFFESCRTYQ